MCLFSKQQFKTKQEALDFKKNLIKTNKDIIVYKVLDFYNYSPYRGFKYEKGFHYTESKLKITIYNFFYSNCYRLQIDRGLHAFINREKAEHSSWEIDKVVKMVIPKGSIVIYGTDKDIVTNNLIWY